MAEFYKNCDEILAFLSSGNFLANWEILLFFSPRKAVGK
jgi:hypothetical protein